MSEPRWLNGPDQKAWRSYLTGSQLLTVQLDKELRARHGIGMAEYEILVRLSEHENRTMRMALLATDTTMSRSRLTHSVARMEKKGLLERFSIPEDGRGVNCQMTEAGWELLAATAPTHVGGVRDHLVDLLEPEEMESLGRVFGKVTAHMREIGEGPVETPPSDVAPTTSAN
ncbi:MAG: MarR family transcriptional regulator [Brevibacterium sp.]|uniref:MarR family winged helix-turn-helix transcriptional regulator n=1 Tax=Brevibacterium sp. TaxID=1701 RepID=UPI0026476B3C|nr:MarR family transcriptional regulator [Brevibacterium sp.]MDN5805980.1 MarR family transcriptional regulator [Brevibacterium sp.]MDN5833312.1 MarR family transcriptional regulator [Brevibacterium sp.]MDN5877757.1 MarR family transcriptional regulator [Brevibacterium sp.]MDN5908140.1 MarR family transcriptional regulator [Brevibacterium sp.]MDN6124128.1 MarR family transcriptional regulator [Brevibacterium sp.]